MALYKGLYIDDFNRKYPLISLRVGIVKSDLFNSRGEFTLTSKTFDNQYLPSIFTESVSALQGKEFRGCGFVGEKRFAKLYFSKSEYLKVELPFLPGSTEFNQFFIEAYFRNLTEIITVGYEGEFLSDFFLRRAV